MNPLDNQSILALSRILKQGTYHCLFAVEYENTIVVTNNAWLMEWPKHLVDMGCPRLEKLFSNCKHPTAAKGAEKLIKEHWKERLFHKSGKYANVEECEPVVEGYEERDDVILIRCRKEIVPYSWVNFEAAELFVPDADYQLYRQPKEQNMDKIVRLLAIFDNDDRMGQLVGVFTNNHP